MQTSYDRFVTTGDRGGLGRASQLAESGYGRPNAGRDYLYVRASQKEPFDILYLTPAVTAIVNVGDQSFTVIPEVTYSPQTNLEVRLRAAAQVGERATEYGEKRNDYRVELRARYFL